MLRRPKHAPENSHENIQECRALIYIPVMSYMYAANMECRNIILLTLEILPECSGSSATSVVGFTREFRERTAGAKRRLMKQKLKSVSRGAAD